MRVAHQSEVFVFGERRKLGRSGQSCCCQEVTAQARARAMPTARIVRCECSRGDGARTPRGQRERSTTWWLASVFWFCFRCLRTARSWTARNIVDEKKSAGRWAGTSSTDVGHRLCRAPSISEREEEVPPRDQDRPEAARGLDGVGGGAQAEGFSAGRGGQASLEGIIQRVRGRLCLLSCRSRDGEKPHGRGWHVGRLLRARGSWQVRRVAAQGVGHAE
jgi:hypothetical protein